VKKPELGSKFVPAEVKAHRFIELDSLRGLAASVVVFGHFAMCWNATAWHGWVERSPVRLLFAGHEAVILFFILSGFVLSIPMSADRPPGYALFLKKRFCRIYLPYLAAILAAAVCDLFLYSTTPTGNAWMDQTWSSRPTLGLVAGHLITFTWHSEQLNTAIWSLIVEIHISILFPALFWVVRRAHPAVLLGICVAVSAVFPLLPHGIFLAGLTVSPTYVAMFVVGILLWIHLPEVRDFLAKIGRKGLGTMFLLALVCITAPRELNAWSVLPAWRSLPELEDYMIGAGAAGLMACAIEAGRFRSMLLHPVLVRLGALSYSTYLMHPTVLFVLIRLFYGRFPFYYLLPVYLAGVYGVSELFHKFIDQPAVMLGRKVGKRKKLGERAPI